LRTKEGPRDRAVSFGSKQTLIQAGGECAKQFSFTDGPFRGTSQQIMPQIAEVFAEVFGTVSKRLEDIERLGQRQDSRQSQQKFLPNAVTGF
jgi:hypothetical protein